MARHPSEPQCVYDPVDGLALAPDTDPIEKIRMLEEEVCTPFLFYRADHQRPYTYPAKLKIQLQEQSNNMSPTHHNQAHYSPGSASSSSVSNSNSQTLTGSKSLLHSIKNGSALALRQDSISPELQGVTDRSSADALLELIYSGWNPDLPEPHILNH